MQIEILLLIVVINISSSKNNGTYTVGEIIDIEITFSELVFVTGTPQLALETGGIDAVVDYFSGSGTITLVFRYTVVAGQNSYDCD